MIDEARCVRCKAVYLVPVWVGSKEYEARRVVDWLNGHECVPPPVSVCGTRAGYYRHLSRQEPPCDGCGEAMRAYARARYRPVGADA